MKTNNALFILDGVINSVTNSSNIQEANEKGIFLFGIMNYEI